ncbi:EAL domain-containing protein [Wenzhouxiangella sp. AB-CW3]|uniref:putative bifunctional diguanylate cyclase/phosphodiesterase n=1 Tax=Wenzhouxiangella sp. AB-CW3 TaxID=2771012 RepID=UPI00168AEF9B|nr:EAL domain-containing protein [Wenzhouxiangella sp. AB-CW3]QOC23450.1 EAL domain-containing protein [Wenzhouxiangella sp. AB-CW3]
MVQQRSLEGPRLDLVGDISLEDLTALLLDVSPGIFFLLDRAGRLRLWNRRLEKLVGIDGEQIAGRSALDFFGPAEAGRVERAIERGFDAGSVSLEAAIKTASGEQVPYHFQARRAQLGRRTCLAGAGLDISRVMEVEEEHEVQRAHLKRLARHVPGMIFQLQRDGDGGHFSMPFASAKIREVFGVSHGEVADDASALFDRIHPDDIERVMRAVEVSASGLSPFYQQFRMCPPSGPCNDETVEWVEVNSGPERRMDGSIIWHGFARLVTRRKRLEQRLTRLAYTDDLTGLPNRAHLYAMLEDELALAAARREGLALLYLDLDSFNDINDAWGHTAGDRLLRRVATRLGETMDEHCTLGRLGGDEFLVILRTVAADRRAEALAAAVAEAMKAPMRLESRQVRMTVSCGISLFPEDADNAEDLVRHADAALFKAKAGGPGHWARYSPELTEAARARRYLETELRTAIERREIQVALQPIVSLKTGRPVAVEALARWHHSDDGWISPDRFIAMAENRGMIAQLGEQVYRRAMSAVANMDTGLRLAINIAPSQLLDETFCDQLVALAEEVGLDPGRLEVELTERVFMEDALEPIDQIRRLREAGISVAIDDFGTGFSSLDYTRRLPVQRLKIDQRFVRHIEDDATSGAIVRAVSSLARDLGMRVTAEGVETEAEAGFVREVGCDCAQGWYFGRPELVR